MIDSFEYISWPADDDPEILTRWTALWWKSNPPEKNRNLDELETFSWQDFIGRWRAHYRNVDAITQYRDLGSFTLSIPKASGKERIRGLIANGVVYDESSSSQPGLKERILSMTKEEIEEAAMGIRNIDILAGDKLCQYVTNVAKGIVCNRPKEADIHTTPFGHEYQETPEA